MCPGTKTEASDASVPVLPALERELRAHRERQAVQGFDRIRPRALVFQTPPRTRPAAERASCAPDRARSNAGLGGTNQEPVGLHDLHHSLAANSFALGLTHMELARLLRHADPKVTLTVYAGLTDKAVAKLGEKLTSGGFGSDRPSGHRGPNDAEDLLLDVGRLPCVELIELSVGHHLGVSLEPRCDLLLLCRREDVARLRLLREDQGQRGEHDRACEGEAERREPITGSRKGQRPGVATRGAASARRKTACLRDQRRGGAIESLRKLRENLRTTNGGQGGDGCGT